MTTSSPFNRLWALLTPDERRRGMTLLGLMLVGMTLEMLSVGLVIPAIVLLTQNDVVSHYPFLRPLFAMLGNASQHTLVVAGILSLVGVYLVKAVFLVFLASRQTQFVFEQQAQLSQRLFTLYLYQPYTFHLQRNSAQLIRNVMSEVGLLSGYGILPVLGLLSESLVILGLAGLLLAVEPVGTSILMSVMGVAAWVYQILIRRFLVRWSEARQYHEGMRLQHLQQGLGAAKDVKLLGRESEFLRQYSVHNKQSARAIQLRDTLQQLPRLWLELLAVGGLAVLVMIFLARGKGVDALLPVLGMFSAAAFRLLPSLNRVVGALQSFRYGVPIIEILHTELFSLNDAKPNSRLTPITFNDTLEVRQVTYTYPGVEEPSLRNVTLTIRRNECIGIIGQSGAGKSTLVDIMLGLLTPDKGTVLVDSIDVQTNLRGWQDMIGYVPQSIYLSDDTLRRNVAFGLSDSQINDEAVWRALRAAQVEQFVNELPKGLNTMVGERGVRLSGGQRQRIGIARALYHDPPVVVLDEATSSLDTATERGFLQAIDTLQGAKTIVVVAHRLSTVAHCDRLYRMEQSRVVEVEEPSKVLRNADHEIAQTGPISIGSSND